MKFRAIATFAALAAFGVGAENLLPNGSFETGGVGKAPDHWNFVRSGDADAEIYADASEAAAGSRSLFMINRSPRKPNVFGALSCMIAPKPGVEYVLSGYIKGENASPVLFCIGQKWDTRMRISDITPEWKKFQLKFTLKPEQLDAKGRCPFLIITEDLTSSVRIDDLVIAEAGGGVIPAAEMQKNSVWRVDPYNGPLEGLKAIPAGLPVLSVPDAGKFGRAAVAYDARGLIFFVEAPDATPNLVTGDRMWSGDSVQIRIDQAGKSSSGPEETDLEFGLAVGKDSKLHTWNWGNASELPADAWTGVGFRDAERYFAAIRLDWKYLSAMNFPARKYFTFNIVFNDSDAQGQRTVHFLAPGLHDTKSAAAYPQLLLADPAAPSAGVKINETVSPDVFTGTLIAVGLPTKANIEAEVKDSAGKIAKFPLRAFENLRKDDIVKLEYKLQPDAAREGALEIRFLADGKELTGYGAVKSDPVKLQSARLDKAIARLGALKKQYAAFYGDCPYSAYVSIPLAVLDDMLPKFRSRFDAASGNRPNQLLHAERLEMNMPETEAALADLEALLVRLQAGETLPETWHYTSGPVELVDGWPYAELRSSAGRTERRPVMFDGYGHFSSMKPFFNAFSRYGANIVQFEYGPRSIYLKEGANKELEADFSDFEKNFRPMIEGCWQNNLQLCLLISPHYAPAWWLEKHPEVKTDSGFLKYNILHPEARKLMGSYIRDFLPRIKSLPNPEVIHSICILNEPVYTVTRQDPTTVKAFDEYLEQKFGAEAKKLPEKVLTAEFVTFRKQVMTDWAKFLVDEVKAVWPEIPAHAKIMIMNSTFADHAVDPESFALISDYNGNDNYGNYKEGGYLSDWLNIAVGDELQYSMKPVSIINAENHIIRDAEKRPIPNEHIYTANFQQHLTGASALVTWVWEDYRPEQEVKVVHDLHGNIALRPGNVIAQGIAQLDATRLAPELLRFTQSEPAIALLYSPTTLGYSPDSYKSALFKFYAETAFTGRRVRFVSERQLAEGDLGGVKLLLAVGTPNLSEAARSGLEKFHRDGGKVAADRFSLKRDGLDREMKLNFTPEEIPDFVKASELNTRFFDAVDPQPVKLTGNTEGIFFRAVPAETAGEWLINLVNYNAQPAKLKLQGEGAFVDLIAERPFQPEFTLDPLKPMVIKFAPVK